MAGKKYTISTMIFDSKEEAIEQLKQFATNGKGITEGTVLFEVSAIIPFTVNLEPVITLEEREKI